MTSFLILLLAGLELTESHLLAVVSAMSLALATLWRSQHQAHLRTEARANECDDRVAKLLDRIERLEAISCSLPECPVRRLELEPPGSAS